MKARVQFIDVLRLLALAQMVNGHTLHALLEESVRSGGFYSGYLWFRGLVSVAFMLVAGLAFQLTTLARWDVYRADPAARRRRVLRAIEIIAIGLVLRFPVSALLSLDFERVRHGLTALKQVDVLPCIGVSLLVLEALTRVCRRPGQVVIAAAALSAAAGLLTPFGAMLPTAGALGFATGWLGPQAGSSFPLLPFSGYVFAGVVIGAIALPQGSATPPRAIVARLLASSLGLAVCAALAVRSSWALPVPNLPGVHTPSFYLEKLAAVSLLLCALAFLLRRAPELPAPLRTLSGETLAIYVFHLFVLYGYPLALARRLGQHLPLWAAGSVSLSMLGASALFGLGWHAFKRTPRKQRYLPGRRQVVLAACSLLGVGAGHTPRVVTARRSADQRITR